MGGNILKQQIDRCGYLRVRPSINGRKLGFIVHRIIAITFIPNIDNKPQVNHRDGDKTNNVCTNLEWVTNGENQNHAIETGLKVMPVAEQAIRFTGAVKVFKDGTQIDTLYGNADMKSKGYDFRLVSACLMGKRHTHRECTFIKEEE